MDTKLRRRAVGVIAAVVLVVTTLAGIVGSAGVAGASVSNSQNLPPIYSNWAQNSTNWPCYATPSYACTNGGYATWVTSNPSGQWPWTQYGPGQASSNSYGLHNCTLYAAYRLMENGSGPLPNLGDAAQWASSADNDHFRVDQTPAVGSIAQWNQGGGGSGHVAYVESVDPGDSGITVTEDNYIPGGAQYFAGGYTAEVHITAGSAVWPANFIHIKDVSGGGVNAPPTITTLSHFFGAPGIAISISGSNFVGVTSVRFNGVAATIKLATDSQILTAVPDNATSGKLSVITPGGQVSAQFRVERASDINGDGNSDIVMAVAAAGGKVNYLYGLSQGNGHFLLQSAVGLQAQPKPVFVTTGDINGDGNSDIVMAVAAAGGKVNYLYGLSQGNGHFLLQSAVGLQGVSAPVATI